VRRRQVRQSLLRPGRQSEQMRTRPYDMLRPRHLDVAERNYLAFAAPRLELGATRVGPPLARPRGLDGARSLRPRQRLLAPGPPASAKPANAGADVVGVPATPGTARSHGHSRARHSGDRVSVAADDLREL